ncbi:MAG: glycerol-3-phosphate 1-O-acyltransferase PlsY [Oscillospiraceae bacterium]|nr:glycerol-3-phosphate 1-O-acyltransferase PlsY [Oscillospiraceae bacterium]
MFELLKQGLCNKYFSGSTAAVVISVLVVFIIGYLLGSLNFGVIISKVFYHDDVRKYGSGGAGATNVQRVYGNLPAAVTFLGDGLKAAAAVLVGAVILGHNSLYAGTYIGGMASVIGHAFPVYYGFKGGKSIAAAFFMVLCTSPLVGLTCFAIFLIIVAVTKYVSLGSVIAILAYPLILNRMTGYGAHNWIAIFIMLFIVYLHRSNIKRLLNGTENKLDLKGKRKSNGSSNGKENI